MHPALAATALFSFTLANALTCYLYLYPAAHRCSFPTPPKAQSSDYDRLVGREQQLVAPFRLLVFGDPQLEGDSSLPPAVNLGNLSRLLPHALRRPWQSAEEDNDDKLDIKKLVTQEIPNAFQFYRKKLDLLGNDFYLAHIYRTVSGYTYPTHVAVLGDLLGSQWLSDEEFARRGDRFWYRVFHGGRRIQDDISGDRDRVTSLAGEEVRDWKRRIINVAGNHDIGYAGDINRGKVDRFERTFGKVNWDTRFSLPVAPELGIDTPQLRIVVLNSLNLDTPVLERDIQAETYDYINDMINTASPVGDNTSATLLLTHLPLYKEAGVCTDGPLIEYYPAKNGAGVKEQNHLSYDASKSILEGIFGLSGEANAPAGGLGRHGLIMTGHDHEGCDVLHHLPVNDNDDRTREWKALRLNVSSSTAQYIGQIPSLREITVRSMMGDFGGNAGLLSAWFDLPSRSWRFEYATCALGKQHLWWAVHVFDLITLGLVNVVLWNVLGEWRPSQQKQKKEKTS